jgi:hypothetical protein
MTQQERFIHEMHLRFQKAMLRPATAMPLPDADATVLAKPEIKGVKYKLPTSEQWVAHHATWHPEGWYRVHCAHDILLVFPCTTCKRNKREADRNYLKICEMAALRKATAKP